MNDLFLFAAHNTVVAVVFALFVSGLTRIWRNPPVAHVLWLLVLLKLVAPPVMRVDWSALWLPGSTPARGQIIAEESRIEGQMAESHPRFVDRPTARTTAQASATSVQEHELCRHRSAVLESSAAVLLWLWLGGAALCALIAATRIVRFERLLRDTLPASERLQRLTLGNRRQARRSTGARRALCRVRRGSLALVRRSSPDDRLADAAAPPAR